MPKVARMNNQQAMIELIKATSGQANILTIPRPYIEFMGSLDGGLFLSQLIYWSDRGGQDDGWFIQERSGDRTALLFTDRSLPRIIFQPL